MSYYAPTESIPILGFFRPNGIDAFLENLFASLYVICASFSVSPTISVGLLSVSHHGGKPDRLRHQPSDNLFCTAGQKLVDENSEAVRNT